MTVDSAYDVVCVGGGTAGMTAARAAAHAGARVLLAEREPSLGGECTFTGCVPSKTLIHAAKVLWDARNATHLGITGRLELDFGRLAAWQRQVVAEVAHDERDEVFTSAGIEVAHGAARVVAPDRVAMGDRVVTTRRVVLATGSEPRIPSIPGLDRCEPLTNESIFQLIDQPRCLLVIGGGPIGVELAQTFNRLGTKVTLVQRRERLLPREEPDASAVVALALRREGVEVELDATVAAVEQHAMGWNARLENRMGTERRVVAFDRVLVAAGREPRLAGLDELGAKVDGGIVTDERCRTSVAGVFAAGDCVHGPRFTHAAAHVGRVAGLNAAGQRTRVDIHALPWVTFTDPEVARVGMTESQARQEHDRVQVVSVPMTRVDRARTMGQTDGFIRLIVAENHMVGRALMRFTGGHLVGCHIVGPGAGEMLHEAVLAMQTNTIAGRIAQTIHAYPTMAMGLQQAAAQLFPGGRALVPIDGGSP